MKRPLAYITAAWCGDPDTDMEIGRPLLPDGIRSGLFSYLPYSLSAAVHQRRYPGGTQKRD